MHRTSPSYANSIQIDTFYLYINFGLNSACKNQHWRFWKVSINTQIKVFSMYKGTSINNVRPFWAFLTSLSTFFRRWLTLSSFQRNHLVVEQICLPLNFFVRACTVAFSAHSNLLYADNKYANGTTICTSLTEATQYCDRAPNKRV